MDENSLLEAQVAELKSLVTLLEGRVAMLEAESDGGGVSDDSGVPKIEDVMTDGSGSDIGPFAVVDGKITNRIYMVARTMCNVSGDDPDASDGTWFLVVQHSNNTAQLVNYSLSPSTDVSTSDTQTSIPIYKIQDGEISEDFRGMPLVMIRE